MRRADEARLLFEVTPAVQGKANRIEARKAELNCKADCWAPVTR